MIESSLLHRDLRRILWITFGEWSLSKMSHSLLLSANLKKMGDQSAISTGLKLGIVILISRIY